MINSAPAQRPERVSYNGNSYQVTDIVEVKGSNATLRTTDNKVITLPIRFLSSRLKVKAEAIQKRMKSGDDLYTIDRNWKFTFIHTNDNDYLPPDYKEYLSKFISE